MTESVSLPRSRSRSNRSSARARPRSAAAAGNTSARTTARPGNAPAGDAPRDERTLDLFGDPVLEPAARASAAVRDEAVAEVDAVAGDDAGRQATLDGFSASGGAARGDAEGAVEPPAAGATMNESAATHGKRDALGDDAVRRVDADAGKGADVARQSEGIVAIAADEPATDAGLTEVHGVSDASTTKIEQSTANAVATDGATADRSAKPGNDADGVDVASVPADAARTPDATTKGRRASSSGKRRATAGAGAAAAVTAVPASTGSTAAPDPAPSLEQQAVPEPVEPAATASPHDADRPVAAPASASVSASAEVQPVASVASFMTKPSADRAQAAAPNAPALDPDAQLRPLSERLAALQGEMAGVKRAADREMRRVNRLLLALAFVVFAALVTLVLQTRQVANLKQELDVRQQRVDRLAADLSTQQATLMTLAEHHEALLSQVDRLQRNANREAAAAKRARRTR
ncbi:flagellar hook-length control protein FliK [Burkholderia anthina]|uniref:flagellar hook-length control protein FliK n=1 Tax=Burkholderia anthina TaxID=179879 RepID=UPI001AA04717|nr:flagellar hook-length control protein FliK [Burkholderia anthina]QTD92842.1 flagellar hook-length control protein FliK [Burkholderia anthina]